MQLHPDITVDWTVRPLSKFEHQGLHDVASVHDLIIYDHPFSGSIVQTAAFLPLSGLPGLRVDLSDADRYLGGSLLSYRIGGTVWGLPIDAATQHAVYRADLINGSAVPVSWTEALTLGKHLSRRGMRLGLAVQTPHAILTIAALMANLGHPWETAADAPFQIDKAAFIEAFDQIMALLQFCPQEAIGWNAIDLHEAMVARDDIAYAPCVYGYGTYGEADQRRRLSFGPFAGLRAPYHAGSVLGGTGLGISRQTPHPQAALAFLRFAASDAAQLVLTPQHHGQPAVAAAWSDPALDETFNGFFSAVAPSIIAAWTRPRYAGYIAFQDKAGRIAAEALGQGGTATQVYAQIEPLFAAVNQ